MNPRLVLSILIALGCSATSLLAQQDRAPKAPAPAPIPANASAAQPASSIRFGQPKAPAKAPGTIRLATYNVENFFKAPSEGQQLKSGQQVKPIEHVKALADTIRALDADVIALEEVESMETLLWFRDTYLKGMGYDHAVSIDAGDTRGIENSVLSRFPLSGEKVWVNLPLGGEHPPTSTDPEGKPGTKIEFRRSPLRVTVTVPAEKTGSGAPYAFSLWAVHHKSGRDNGYWREAESAKIVELIREETKDNPEANVVILGDFNALLVDASVKTYRAAGFSDSLTERQAGSPQWTTHESGRAIDQILLNQKMMAELSPKSGFILGTPARPAGVDWRTFPPPAGYASDHYPVAIDLVPKDEAAKSTPAAN